MKAIYKLFFSLLAAAFAAAVSSCTTELEEQSFVSGLRPLSITTSIVEAQEVKGRAPIHTGKEFKAGDRIEFFGTNIYTADGNAINSFHAVMQDNGQWTFSPEVMVGPEPAGISAYTLAGPNDVVDMISVGYPKEYYALYNGNPEVNFYFRHTKALVSFDIHQVEGSGVLTSAQLVDLGEQHIVGSFCDGLEKNAKYFLTNISTACPGVSKNETDDSKLEEAKAEYAAIVADCEKSYYDLCIPNWRYSLDSNGTDVVNIKSYLTGEPLRVSFLNIPTELDGKEGRAALQLVIDDKTYQVEIPATEWVGGKHYIYPVKVDLSQPADKVLSISDATIEGWGEATDLPGINIGVEHPSAKEIETFEVEGVKFNMIKVEAGTFEMGKSADGNDETPVHTVTLTKDYYIGESEVTQALWKAVTGYSPTSGGDAWSSSYGLGDNYPAYFISYEDVQTFITRLNQMTNQQFRMPTEAEWEYAAKGGKQSKGHTYSGSNTIDDVAWYKNNSGKEAHPVKTKSPNELGIYDMSGNVDEWCSDWYGDYSSEAVTDPMGPTSGSHRVTRGGTWINYAAFCSTASRGISTPTIRDSFIGFRLALSLSK